MPDLSLIGDILTRTAILMFVFYVVEAVATYFVSSWGHILGARIESDMRRDLFMHMERLSFSFFDKTSTGHMVSRLISDLADITGWRIMGLKTFFYLLFRLLVRFSYFRPSTSP